MNARARMILAIVGVVVICALVFFLLVRSRQGELAAVRTEIEAEENRALQLTAELNRLKDLQERAPELQARLAQIRELVPPEHEVPHLIFLIEDARTVAGVDFLSITPDLPGPPPEQAPLAEVGLSIAAEGGYFSLQDFVRRLYDLDRALRIDTVSMGAEEGEGGSLISLDVTARIFLELPAAPGTEQEPANVPPPTAPVGEPAATPPAGEEAPATP